MPVQNGKGKSLHSNQSPLAYSSIEELNRHADSKKIDIKSAFQCKQYCQSSNGVYKKADALYHDGDEENAYILFMRYFNIVSQIKKTYEFAKSKNTYLPILKQSDAVDAITKAEKLSASLEKRYEKLAEQRQLELELRKDAAKKARADSETDAGDYEDLILPEIPGHQDPLNPAPNVPKANTADSSEKDAILPDSKEVPNPFMSVMDLYNLFMNHNSSSDSILIIDTRPPDEYSASRIMHSCSINIPNYLLQFNANINSVERRLPRSTWDVWSARNKKKHIILVDFDSDQRSFAKDSPIQVLKDIIYPNQMSAELEKEPFILDGGFQKWLLHFPSFTTDPSYKRFPSRATHFQDPSMILKNLTYPELPIPDISSSLSPKATVLQESNDISVKGGRVDKQNDCVPITKPTVGDSTLNYSKDKLDKLYRFLEEHEEDEDDDDDDDYVDLIAPTGSKQNIVAGKAASASAITTERIVPPSSALKKIDDVKNDQENQVNFKSQNNKNMILPQTTQLSELKSEISAAVTLSNITVSPSQMSAKVHPQQFVPNKPQPRNDVLDGPLAPATTASQNADTHTKPLPVKMSNILTNFSNPKVPSTAVSCIQHPANTSSSSSWDTGKNVMQDSIPNASQQNLAIQKPMSSQGIGSTTQRGAHAKLPNGPSQIATSISTPIDKQVISAALQEQQHNKGQISTIINSAGNHIPLQQVTGQTIPKSMKTGTFSASLSDKDMSVSSNVGPKLAPQLTSGMPNSNLDVKGNIPQVTSHIPQIDRNTKNTAVHPNMAAAGKMSVQNTQPARNLSSQNSDKMRTESGATTKSKSKFVTTYGLPCGWEKAIHHETGRVYYKDHNTQKTYWTLPPGLIAQNTHSSSKPNIATSTEPTFEKTNKPAIVQPKEPQRPKLKRSLSSPNINELDDQAKERKPTRPVIDRSAKPKEEEKVTVDRSTKPLSATRLHNLSPVYGSKGKGLTGLKNLGNTCYMNAAIQCLINTIPLAQYLNTGTYEKDLNLKNMNPYPSELARELGFLAIVLTSGQYRSVSPVDFKGAVGRFCSQFSGYDQQDAHEFLMFFLDGLHEDVNKVKVKQAIKEQDNKDVPDQIASDRAWKDYILNNDSVVVNLFQGQFRSTVVCLHCKQRSKIYDTFNCLQLQLPPTSSCMLEECISSFTKHEKIGGNNSWKCSSCNCYREAAKTIEIWKLPPILIIQLKRFSFDGRWHNKIQTPVTFPVSELNMGKHVVAPSSKFTSYKLYGVVNHYGSFMSGHYTSFCENAFRNKWYTFDDNIVKDMDRSSVRTNAAYLLFYTALNFKDYIK